MRSLCSSASKQLPTITLVATIFFFTLSFAQPTAAQQQAALGGLIRSLLRRSTNRSSPFSKATRIPWRVPSST